MKFTTTAEELKSAFLDVSELATQVGRFQYSILSFLSVMGDGIRVTGTNLHLAVQVEIQGSIEKGRDVRVFQRRR